MGLFDIIQVVQPGLGGGEPQVSTVIMISKCTEYAPRRFYLIKNIDVPCYFSRPVIHQITVNTISGFVPNNISTPPFICP